MLTRFMADKSQLYARIDKQVVNHDSKGMKN